MFKRSLLGYRRAEVDVALASRDDALEDAGQRLITARKTIDSRDLVIGEQRAELEVARDRIADLERVATKLSERVVERERELKRMRSELSELHASSDQGMKALVAVAAELDAIRGQARGQATRIRMQALSEAAELSDRLSMIAQRPVEVRERLVAALSEAIAETRTGPSGPPGEGAGLFSATEAPAEASSEGIGEEPDHVPSAPVAGGSEEREEAVAQGPDPIGELAAEVEAVVAGDAESIVISGPTTAEPQRELVHPGDLFNGRIEVEIGPLGDFAQLVGFEDAASGIAGTSEITVKRFAKGRATLEMLLDAPIELLRELEGRAPFGFRVRDTRDDRVILDLDAE